jgi:hypothetical protein
MDNSPWKPPQTMKTRPGSRYCGEHNDALEQIEADTSATGHYNIRKIGCP